MAVVLKNGRVLRQFFTGTAGFLIASLLVALWTHLKKRICCITADVLCVRVCVVSFRKFAVRYRLSYNCGIFIAGGEESIT